MALYKLKPGSQSLNRHAPRLGLEISRHPETSPSSARSRGNALEEDEMNPHRGARQ